MIYFWVIIQLLILSYSGWCAPVISNVTGTIAHGGSITITSTGTNFGTGDTTPILYDDFEDGTVGQTLNATPKVGTWIRNNTPYAYYNSDHYRSGSQCSFGSKESSNIYTQFQTPTTGNMPDTHYYASWWGKYYNPCSTPGQVKMIQLWGTYQLGDYSPGFFYGPGSSAYIALESGMTENAWPSYPSENNWHFIELILKQSDINIANGSITVKVNNSVSYTRENVKTRVLDGHSWLKLIPWEGMTNQSGCTGTRYLALDDFYMNNSWARVEIGDNATYSSCTLREIQLPSSWSTSSITATVNRGAFGETDTAYLFVIDSDGNASDGYPITFGGSNAPTIPGGVTISGGSVR